MIHNVDIRLIYKVFKRQTINDMNIFARVTTIDDKKALQCDLNRVQDYCHLNKIYLNPPKCTIFTYDRTIR